MGYRRVRLASADGARLEWGRRGDVEAQNDTFVHLMQISRIVSHAVLLCFGFFVVGSPHVVGEGPDRDEHPQKIPPPCAFEPTVTTIPIAGELMTACGAGCAEISGLAWYRDHLILLPQYPELFPSAADGKLFAIPKAEIIAYLEGRSQQALVPKPFQLVAPNVRRSIPGYQGYEAIAFDGDRAILVIEAKEGKARGRSVMTGYVVAGVIRPDLSALEVDPTTLTQIPAQTSITNMSYETAVIAKGSIILLNEANGRHVNPSPLAHLFDLKCRQPRSLTAPPIEYRITDATSADENGRFWVINFFYPGDRRYLRPAEDTLVDDQHRGCTHGHSERVERLVELEYTPSGIRRSDTPVIQLKLTFVPRNWEGIARLDERGFLLATDRYPLTILAFVPGP